MHTTYKKTALITGASSGIGFQLARQFAKHGYDLILTGRDENKLNIAGEQVMREFSSKVLVIVQDLEIPGAARQLHDSLKKQGIQIDVLVNDAGFGQKGNFAEIPLERDIAMIQVNIVALLSLTKLFLPDFIARREGKILNLASTASFQPGPLVATYYASKAFVLSLSEALATELEGTGVTVTALCPGATDTNFFPEADMQNTTIFQQGNVMAPHEVAEIGYEALMKGERVVVAGAINKAMVFSTRLASEHTLSHVAKRLHTDVDPEDLKRFPGDIAAKAEDASKA